MGHRPDGTDAARKPASYYVSSIMYYVLCIMYHKPGQVRNRSSWMIYLYILIPTCLTIRGVVGVRDLAKGGAIDRL